MQKVEQEARELLTSSSTAIEELLQAEKKVQALTEVEIANESITGISEKRDDGQFSISPTTLIEFDGEKNSSSSQLHNGGVKGEEAKTHLTAEEGLLSQEVEITGASAVQGKQSRDTIMAAQEATSAQNTGIEDHLDANQDITQEVEITVTGASSVPGTQLNVEESRDLNKDETICVEQEGTIMESQEATSAQTTGIEDHLDAAQDINLERPHDVVGLQIEKEVDSAISSNLDGKKMEPQELNSSQKVEDETTEEVQMSLALTRDFPSGIVCKSDHTEMGKEESQDTEALAHTVPPQDAELHPFSVTVRYESTKEVENLSEHTVSSSNDLVMEVGETLEIESQEQVPIELLAGEGIHDEVSKGSTEIIIEEEVPVKPEISNNKKDLEAFLPENEPGKENRNEFLQEASEPLEKIDSCQHSERMISVQEQKSTEGDICEEKDSTSNASKSEADNSLQEVRIF